MRACILPLYHVHNERQISPKKLPFGWVQKPEANCQQPNEPQYDIAVDFSVKSTRFLFVLGVSDTHGRSTAPLFSQAWCPSNKESVDHAISLGSHLRVSLKPQYHPSSFDPTTIISAKKFQVCVLDSSFNPPTLAHQAMLQNCAAK